MKRIVILSGDTDYNRGDRAILSSILQALKTCIPDVDITILSGHPAKDRELFRVKTVSRSVRGLFGQIRALVRADLIIWGGGVSLQDDESRVKIPFWAAKILLVKLLGKPIAGYAQGIGPLKTRLGRRFARFTVDKIDLISVRDENSAALLREVGVKKTPIYVSADPALNLSPVSGETARESLANEGITGCPLIGIAPRLWFHQYGSWIPHKYAVKYKLREIPGAVKFNKLKLRLAMGADYMVKKFGARIVFFPMYPVCWEGDDRISEEIIQLMERGAQASVLKNDYPPSCFKAVIGQMDMFIGMRMHSTILSTAMFVPSINISYVPKGRAFFKMINQESLVINAEELIADDGFARFCRLIDYAWENRSAIKNRLKQELAIVKERERLNVELVRKLLYRDR